MNAAESKQCNYKTETGLKLDFSQSFSIKSVFTVYTRKRIRIIIEGKHFPKNMITLKNLKHIFV